MINKWLQKYALGRVVAWAQENLKGWKTLGSLVWLGLLVFIQKNPDASYIDALTIAVEYLSQLDLADREVITALSVGLVGILGKLFDMWKTGKGLWAGLKILFKGAE